MESRVVAKYLRISPRKLRQVADLIRNKDAVKALDILECVAKRGSVFLKKAIDSAVASAVRNKKNEPGDLLISKLIIDTGPMMKRYRAGSMGRASLIRKRTSSITLELEKKKINPNNQTVKKSSKSIRRKEK